MDVFEYLEKLQQESENGFHRKKRLWVDEQSSIVKFLREFAEEQA